VSVDEADISRVKVGQPATFTVDAYPEQSFSGKVVQIRSAPVVNQNVVTYVVVVNVDNKDLKLKPGMTANVSIVVAKKDDVLKIPPAAFRFKPRGGENKPENAKRKPESAGTVSGKGGREGGGKPGERKGGGGQVLYVLKDGKPLATMVTTGIASSNNIELVEGDLKDGDEVIVEQIGGDTKKKSSGLMGRPF
jgi:HlyD family secretion protein